MTRRKRRRPGPIATTMLVGAVVGGLGIGLASEAGPAARTASSAETATVTRVIDGDTFVTSTNDRVRVLGINACERGTAGGQTAGDRARTLLAGQDVTLRAEPGHDRDRYGRALRYVELPDGRDLAEVTVPERDVEVYRGRNDASRERLAVLRAIDGPARVC